MHRHPSLKRVPEGLRLQGDDLGLFRGARQRETDERGALGKYPSPAEVVLPSTVSALPRWSSRARRIFLFPCLISNLQPRMSTKLKFVNLSTEERHILSQTRTSLKNRQFFGLISARKHSAAFTVAINVQWEDISAGECFSSG